MQGRICERLIRSIVPCSIHLHYRLNIGIEAGSRVAPMGLKGKRSRTGIDDPILVWFDVSDCPNQLNSFGRGRGSCVAMYLEHLSLLSLKRLTSGEFDRAA
jgi:hypothetical protein